MGKWYAGVVHSHTTRSDGAYNPDELVKKAEKTGLDFIILTDHNQFCDESSSLQQLRLAVAYGA